MAQFPNIWTLKRLVNEVNSGSNASSSDGKQWYPARPLGFCSLQQRIRAAKLVFTGKADAVIWPGGQ